jgi:hypothetical protein
MILVKTEQIMMSTKQKRRNNMYICDCCKKECNRTINVFITLELCPDCYDKWKSGELGKEKEEEKDKE